MIAIVDYGLGNVLAFVNVYKRLNIPVTVAKTASDLVGASKLILPGVGAFDHAMQRLEQSGMRQAIDQLVMQQGIPVLGICVGMQILGESSDEGVLSGLGWIRGRVRKIDVSRITSGPRLPHMGWNSVILTQPSKLFDRVDLERGFYFLHSYYFDAVESEDVTATVQYGNQLPCAVAHGNVLGMQFHPEKSHSNGITVFRNFAEY